MRKEWFAVAENTRIARDVWRIRLDGNTGEIRTPGQFVNVRTGGYYLRRPLSVCDWDDGMLTLIYKVVGGGTQWLSERTTGDTLDVLTGLGNGFSTAACGENPVLIGGGVGVPPLYGLARRLRAKNIPVTVACGFASAADVFYMEEFAALGCTVKAATMDGTYGETGTVIGLLDGDYTYSYACGPIPMLHAVYDRLSCPGAYSFEERMGCGFGACMGCSCKTKYGSVRICKDGPVLEREAIVW